MLDGILNFSAWQLILTGVIVTQITIASVTLYLHRNQSHSAVELHPIVSHFFRFWIWLTTGMVTKEWVAIHRKHHAKCETEEDPHSPQVSGIGRVFFGGVLLYQKEAKNQETLKRYGQGTPDDWVERNVYSRFPALGLLLLLGLNLFLFGWVGGIIWLVEVLWIPLWAAGVINGVGHFWGYRNYETRDASRNIFPIGFFIGGEELHNNHHGHASSARFAHKWYEFDIGWFYIRMLQAVGLAKVKKVAPKASLDLDKAHVDLETVRAVIRNRFHIMKLYSRKVVAPALRDERREGSGIAHMISRRLRKLMSREDMTPNEQDKETLTQVLTQSETLKTVCEFKQQLKALWQQTATNHAKRLEALQVWIKEAEQSGISHLQEFAQVLRGYSIKTA
ncbi:MAG: fatty acid desaturase [Gammaproteobacteria bacterium]|nr:fatty acid desaturase [Gammaproteobacteria bacterium]